MPEQDTPHESAGASGPFVYTLANIYSPEAAQPREQDFLALKARQKIYVDAEVSRGEPLFLRLPDRWMERPHFRCLADHVSTHVIKSEQLGDMCPACLGPVVLTFPEDVDGPIAEVRVSP